MSINKADLNYQESCHKSFKLLKISDGSLTLYRENNPTLSHQTTPKTLRHTSAEYKTCPKLCPTTSPP